MSGLLLASCADHKQTTMGITKEQISFPIGQRIDNPAFTGEAYLKPLIRDSCRSAPLARSHKGQLVLSGSDL